MYVTDIGRNMYINNGKRRNVNTYSFLKCFRFRELSTCQDAIWFPLSKLERKT